MEAKFSGRRRIDVGSATRRPPLPTDEWGPRLELDGEDGELLMAEAPSGPRPVPARTDAAAKPGFDWLVQQEQRMEASNTLIDFGENGLKRDDRRAAAIRHHPRLGPIPAVVADDARPGMSWLVQQQQAVEKSTEVLIEFDLTFIIETPRDADGLRGYHAKSFLSGWCCPARSGGATLCSYLSR